MEPRARPQRQPEHEGAPGESPAEESPGPPPVPPPAQRPSWHGWAPQRSVEGFEPGTPPGPPLPTERTAPDAASSAPARPFLAAPPPSSPPAPAPEGEPEWPGEVPRALLTPSRSRKLTREIVETILLTLLVFLVIRASFQNFRVQGQSMSPTLEDGQLVIVSPLLYKRIDTGRLDDFIPFLSLREGKRDVFMAPSRGDIIVFHTTSQARSDLVKRVIGMPGETVQIVDGVVYVNDRRLEEPYITEPWSSDLPRTFIPPDYYFVLGDNRNNSEDSRSPRVGLIAREQIVGKALLSWWPTDRFGRPSQAPGELTGEPPPPPRTPTPARAPASPGSR